MKVIEAVTVGIRNSPTVRVYRCTIIIQELVWRLSLQPQGGNVGGLGLVQAPRRVLAYWLVQIGLPVFA